VVATAVSREFSDIRSFRVGRSGWWAVTQGESNFDSILTAYAAASAVPSVQLHVSRRECCASRVTDASRTHAFSIFYLTAATIIGASLYFFRRCWFIIIIYSITIAPIVTSRKVAGARRKCTPESSTNGNELTIRRKSVTRLNIILFNIICIL